MVRKVFSPVKIFPLHSPARGVMFPKVPDHCTSTPADAGLCAQALSLSAEKAGGAPRIAQDGVRLIPYVNARLFKRVY